MSFLISNNLAQSTLASGYTAGNTSLTIQAGDHTKFDAPGGGANIVLAIGNPPQFFLEATSISGDTFTVGSSGFDGSTPVSVTASTPVTEVITSGVLQGLLQGAPGMVLLAEQTAANVASLSFTTRNVGNYSGALVQSDFDEYEVHFLNVLAATNAQNLQMLMSSNGGSTWDTGANYFNNMMLFLVSVAVASTTSGNSASFLQLTQNTATNYGGFSGKFTVVNPGNASLYTAIYGTGAGVDASSGVRPTGYQVANYYEALVAVNAFQFLFASGNILSGTVRVYGIRK